MLGGRSGSILSADFPMVSEKRLAARDGLATKGDNADESRPPPHPRPPATPSSPDATASAQTQTFISQHASAGPRCDAHPRGDAGYPTLSPVRFCKTKQPCGELKVTMQDWKIAAVE